MTEEQKLKESLVCIALAKSLSEQATALTGHLKHKDQFVFGNMVRAVDHYVKWFEAGLPEGTNAALQQLADAYLEFNNEIRNAKVTAKELEEVE